MSSSKDLEERKVPTALNFTIFVTVSELDILNLGRVEVLLSWPLKSLSPSLVTEPIADEISVTSIDQDWNLLQNAWDNTVEWFHPVALE